MRLTLRTLLAYMDDILDPADHEELGKKIEASDFATELIHRSRDTVRRLRLGAPDVIGDDSGDVLGDNANMDANTVAEYLDNTLPPERVAEFEQQCLEQGPDSDMLLAETTSCHHILTMVLGEPAEVDSDLRQRLYRLGMGAAGADAESNRIRIETSHRADPQQLGDRRSDSSPDDQTLEDHVPDYLRAAAAQQRGRRLIVGLAACLVIGAGLAFAFWPDRESDESEIASSREAVVTASPADVENANVFDGEASEETDHVEDQGAGGTLEADRADDQSGSTASENDTVGDLESQDASSPDGAENDRIVEPEDDALESVDGAMIEEVDAEQSSGSVIESASAETLDGESGRVESQEASVDGQANDSEVSTEIVDASSAATDSAAPSDVEATSADPAPNATDPVDMTRSDDLAELSMPNARATPAPLPDLPSNDVATAAEVERDLLDGLLPSQADDETRTAFDEETPAEPTGPRVVGAYLGNDDVLLAFDSATEAWVRMAPGRQLIEGDQLLALPTFRAHVVLDDMNAFLGGGTQMTVGASPSDAGAAQHDAALQLRRGKLLLNAGLNGNRLALLVDQRSYWIELGASSSLAIEVVAPLGAIAEDVSDSRHTTVVWRLVSGSAKVDGPEGEQIAEGATSWTTDGAAASPLDASESAPNWIESEQVTDLERYARDQIALALEAEKPVEITLLEFADRSSRGRRRENRTLASVCSAYVGQFEPFVRALNDADLKAYWEGLLKVVRESLAVDPDAVSQLRRAFRSLRGEAAAEELVELTVGYDLGRIGDAPTEAQESSLRQLVRWLDSDQMAYRVLALQNINELTGSEGRGNYRPWHTANQRSRSLRYYSDLDSLWSLVAARSNAATTSSK